MCFNKLWTGEGNDFSYVYSFSKMISTGRRFPHLADEEASNVRTYFVGKNSTYIAP
jgi:hypothetical protein